MLTSVKVTCNVDILLETYSLSEILSALDLTEGDALTYLVDRGFIEWAALEGAIPLPVH